MPLSQPLVIHKHGFLLLYKPKAVSSFFPIKRIRSITGIKKVGHAGTLDPFAEGLLIIGVGKSATRKIDTFVNYDKEYQFTIQFGTETSTLDPEGDITQTCPIPDTLFHQLPETLTTFIGTYDQMPPQFSAKKINGKRAYELARKGIEVALEPRPITITDLTLLDSSPKEGTCTLSVRCSKGTYVRSLAKDIACALGTVGYVTWLKRTAIGPYSVNDAIHLDDLSLESITPALFNIAHD